MPYFPYWVVITLQIVLQYHGIVTCNLYCILYCSPAILSMLVCLKILLIVLQYHCNLYCILYCPPACYTFHTGLSKSIPMHCADSLVICTVANTSLRSISFCHYCVNSIAIPWYCSLYCILYWHSACYTFCTGLSTSITVPIVLQYHGIVTCTTSYTGLLYTFYTGNIDCYAVCFPCSGLL